MDYLKIVDRKISNKKVYAHYTAQRSIVSYFDLSYLFQTGCSLIYCTGVYHRKRRQNDFLLLLYSSENGKIKYD